MSTCLVLIDLQDGFLSEETRHVIPRIRQLLKESRFDHIAGTQFYNHSESPYVRLMGWSGFMASPELDLHPYAAEHCERVFWKNTYTCFNEEFETYLRENAIDKLYFAGVDTDCCVLKSAADCFERNIPFEVLADCCASNGGANSHQAAIRVMERLLGGKNLKFGYRAG